MNKEDKLWEEIKKLHHKHFDECLNFQLGVCGGIQYHIPGVIEQPLCEKVRKARKEIENEI